jgi:hypothetical protein
MVEIVEVQRPPSATLDAPARQSRAAAEKPSRLTVITLGTATHTDVAGPNHVRFSGRRLPAGTYRLTLVATSPTGLRSTPKTITFTIVK